ncbi:MAG TPA: RluA family pseudouridine synthase [Verrucomicrobiae bacterium]|jgi:23S rRNA pseudouridine1911/1915/1917 synthase|nr:RluA family pseudouridine synthase [Verrucomicrobiae bacterium]
MDREQITVEEEYEGSRLDIFLATVMAERFSRSQIKKLIEEGRVQVQGREVSPHYKVKIADQVEVSWDLKPDMTARAEDIPVEIVYEDEELIVVNKPAGMVVHPAHGNLEHTLVNALLFHAHGLARCANPMRPGIVHRLDKDTSGIMVVAKNDRAHRFLARQFKDHSIDRVYQAIVRGTVQHEEGICEEPVGRAFLNRKKVIVKPSGGKDAATLFKVLKRYDRATLLEVYPKTGRTHQIRVHMSYLGHPVLGDILYGVASPWINRQALHARALGFRHPTTHERLYFESDLPADMRNLLTRLESLKE